MDVDGFLTEIAASPAYREQIVYVHESPARQAEFADDWGGLSEPTCEAMRQLGIGKLYSHQAEAVRAINDGRDTVVVTGTASGKSLCYVAPLIDTLAREPGATALLLFPTKALCQDQFKGFAAALRAAGRTDIAAGVYDGDTPSSLRRKLRDAASVVFSNPDMVHAVVMAQHARWAKFLANLRFLVIDELHVYSGMFGANVAHLLKRLERVCAHYGSRPQIVTCSATIANPRELAEELTGREMTLVDRDGSPRGRRVYVLWNPPRERQGRNYRSRRSANVEAHELMAGLVRRGAAVITFAKAKMTAELISRYVRDDLRETAPQLANKVTPYRGGYLPEERREIERKLFAGELLGVSTTRALELGIDVGALDACIVVGYPGRLSSFLQQSGRAGRRDRDSLVVLVGLDTAVNQYVMTHPEYLFGRPVEQAVIDPDNPFIATGHLRCATHELPLGPGEIRTFGPHASIVLDVLQDNRKVRQIDNAWYHATNETPQHEVSLRDTCDRNVTIQDIDTGEVLGEVNKFDAPPILHPEAIYFHRGDSYRVIDLDITDKFLALVKRVEVDYYTQPQGGTDIHHIDAQLRERPFGTGMAFWGEATAYFAQMFYEKVRFYELDAVSIDPVKLPTFQLETMAVWLVPPEPLLEKARAAGLDVHAGLRGIGYATRMLLPLFITCDTLDFSHTIGAVNAPWQSIFIYERTPLGLGFTRKAYEMLDRILPAVLANIRNCPCEQGCPCCVGKPLRGYTTWDVQRGEASIPSKQAALMVLEGYLGDGSNLVTQDTHALTQDEAAEALELTQALRRRLERLREPEVFHPIRPEVRTEYPETESADALEEPDVAKRAQRRRDFHKTLRKRIAKHMDIGGLDPLKAPSGSKPPEGIHRRGGNLPPTAFPGRPEEDPAEPQAAEEGKPVELGDSLAARARRLKKRRDEEQQGR